MSETVRIDILNHPVSRLFESTMFFEDWDAEARLEIIHDFANRLFGRSLVWDAKSRRVVMKHFSNTSDFLRRK